MHITSPIRSPFEDYYKQKQSDESTNTSNKKARKRERGEFEASGMTTWNPSEQKKIRKDYDSIYSNTLHILKSNAAAQTNIVIPKYSEFTSVIESSNGAPCNVCVGYSNEQGQCETCQGRVCLDCLFRCEICSQICCSACKLTKYYGKYGETTYCTDCL